MKPERTGVSYSKAEIDYIKLAYYENTDEEMATVLNRSRQSVQRFRYRVLQLTKVKKRPKALIAMLEAKCELKVAKMQELIKFCETSTNPYQIDKAKEQLRKLSGL